VTPEALAIVFVFFAFAIFAAAVLSLFLRGPQSDRSDDLLLQDAELSLRIVQELNHRSQPTAEEKGLYNLALANLCNFLAPEAEE
jgi:hypothetical protein